MKNHGGRYVILDNISFIAISQCYHLVQKRPNVRGWKHGILTIVNNFANNSWDLALSHREKIPNIPFAWALDEHTIQILHFLKNTSYHQLIHTPTISAVASVTSCACNIYDRESRLIMNNGSNCLVSTEVKKRKGVKWKLS